MIRSPPVKATAVPTKDDPKKVTTTKENPKPTGEEKEQEKSRTPNVRKSIGEWEKPKPDAKSKNLTPPKKAVAMVPLKPKPKTTPSQVSGPSEEVPPTVSVEAAGSPSKQAEKTKYLDRLTEARACVNKAKLQIGNSRNLKTEIKTEVIQAVERLYQLVKEAESVKGQGRKAKGQDKEEEQKPEKEKEKEVENSELIKKIEEHTKRMQENNERMERLKDALEKQTELLETRTYASVTATSSSRQPQEQTALHSVVVTSKDETESGEEILDRIREVVNAKEGGVKVDRIRKAKDRKVIVGCRTEEERQAVKERLRKAEKHLQVEEMQNKDPMVILRDVLHYNTDEEIIRAMRNQNNNIFKDLNANAQKMEVAYKKRTKNPHTSHIILRVSPRIWQRMTNEGSVHVDLQRVRVADQSPLVQCSLCLGYGHGRRFCKETLEKCSHCGGPHMRSECADWLAGETPSCCNCVHAKIGKTNHNAFSQECTVRRKWEALARATVAYC